LRLNWPLTNVLKGAILTSMNITQRGPKFKEERNRKIYDLYSNPQNRLSTSALARMFQISQTRVMAILNDWKKQMLKLSPKGGEQNDK